MSDTNSSDDLLSSSQSDREPRPLDLVQRWLQAVIMHPGGVAAGADSEAARSLIATSAAEIERVIGRSQALGSLDRLAVYGNAYYARLLECLRESFPVLCRTMGERIFNDFAFLYLQRHPSQSYTLAELGANFAKFLAESQPAQLAIEAEASADIGALPPDWPQFVVDLAKLEWNISLVYDGPGMENRQGLAAESLAAIPAERWSQARLTLAPCLKLLDFRFPVNDYYAQMRELERDDEPLAEHVEAEPVELARDTDSETEEAFVAIPPPQETYLALTRHNYIVHRYPLTKLQFALLSALATGATIEAAVTTGTADSDLSDDELAAALHRWFAFCTAHDFFASVDVAK